MLCYFGIEALDALASEGVQLTHFHTGTNCSPTRAMMLSGADHHLVGLGNMAEVMDLAAPEYRQYPGYEGYLNPDLVSLPELLRDAGYRTYMTGKWHLGLEAHTSPHARGFQRTFAMLEGAAGHLDDMQAVPGGDRSAALFRQNGKLTQIPDDFYSTRFYARKLIEFLRSEQESDAPFFAYLAFTAPHWPLQAPDESIAKYEGAYDEGYDIFFERRLRRQKELGLIDASVSGQPLVPGQKHWDDLSEEERQYSASLMEIYAAMVDDMDRYVGELLQALKEMGEYGRTVVFFMSDNGAESGNPIRVPQFQQLVEACCDNSYSNMGKADSYLAYGPNWARVSSLPSKFFKSYTTQGGILSPAILSYPGAKGQISRYDEFLSVLDIMPTFLALAGVEYPASPYKGKRSLPLKGSSMLPILEGDVAPIHPPDYIMGWELNNHRALRMNDWKIVMSQPMLGDGQWKLYNISRDPSESNDLSEQYPQIFKMMLRHWQDYAAENGVVLLDLSGREQHR